MDVLQQVGLRWQRGKKVFARDVCIYVSNCVRVCRVYLLIEKKYMRDERERKRVGRELLYAVISENQD